MEKQCTDSKKIGIVIKKKLRKLWIYGMLIDLKSRNGRDRCKKQQ